MPSSAADIVTSFIAACERLRINAAIDHLSDDVEYWNVPMPKVFGHDGVRGVLEPFLAPSTGSSGRSATWWPTAPPNPAPCSPSGWTASARATSGWSYRWPGCS